MSSDVVYKASDWGRTFHTRRENEVLGAGAAGPGKTMVLMMDPMEQIQIEAARCTPDSPLAQEDTQMGRLIRKHPIRVGESKGWAVHLRRTRPQLEQTIQRTKRIFRHIDPDARYDAVRYTWTFRSGFKYQFGHCKDPDDWSNYLSAEFSHIAYDELIQFEKEQYRQINSRARMGDPVLRHFIKIRAMSNPLMRRVVGFSADNNPHWVRERFVDPAPEGKVVLARQLRRRDGSEFKHTRLYLPASLYDNPDPEFVRDYEATLLEMPPHIQKALLYGDWYITAGSYWGDDWNPSLHVVRPFRIPSDWVQFRCMDWGFKTPGCVHWYAFDHDGNLYCHKELNFQGKQDHEVAKEIKEIEIDLGLWDKSINRSRIMGPADSQLWEMRGDKSLSKAAVFENMGITWVPADKKSRQNNAELLAGRLKDHRNQTTTPGMVYTQNCRKIIRTLPGIQADIHNPCVPQKGGDDHAVDVNMYAAAYASRGQEAIAGVAPISGDDWDITQEDAERGQLGYGLAV